MKKFNLVDAVGLIGIGYLVRDYKLSHPKKIPYSSNNRLPSYSEYFKELVINTVDAAVYGRFLHFKTDLNGGGYFKKNQYYPHIELENVTFDSRYDAELSKDALSEIVEVKGMATIADLKELAGIDSKYTDKDWGWNDIDDVLRANVVRKRKKWIIDLIRPKYLKPYGNYIG